jgi:MFS family permease
MMKRIGSWLTRLYPRAWRERYEAEFDVLLEQCLHSPLDVVDVFLGAIDAHLQLLNGENVTWRRMNMINKIRTTLLIVFAAYIGFIIAGFSLVGLADDSPMIPLMKTDFALAGAWRIIQAGAAVALLAIVIGATPLVLTIFRRVLTSHRRDLGLLLVPVFSFLAIMLYLGFIFLVGSGRIQIPGVLPAVQPGNFPPGNRLMLAGLALVFVFGAIASTLAVWEVVSHTDVEQETFRPLGRPLTVKIYSFAFIPAVIASVSMLITLIATLVWFNLTFSALPQVYTGNFGPWQTSTQGWFIGIVALMTVCTIAAFFGLIRGRSARLLK